jgi:DNA polymerase III sliding clamp (beta) subunit (PCNA family)
MTLYSVVKNFKKDDLCLDWSGDTLTIDTNKGRLSLPVIMGRDDWIESPKNITLYEAPKGIALEIDYIVKQESPRNYGSVALLHNTNGKSRIVATDGFRLAYQDFLDELPEKLNDICINKMGLEALKYLSQFGSFDMGVNEDNNTLHISQDSFDIFIRLSAVKYPKYSAVIPSVFAGEIELDRKPFLETIKQALPLPKRQ